MSRPDITTPRIAALIASCADGIEASQIMAQLRVEKSHCYRVLRALHESGRVHIDRWRLAEVSGKHVWVSTWANGHQEDCPKPPSRKRTP